MDDQHLKSLADGLLPEGVSRSRMAVFLAVHEAGSVQEVARRCNADEALLRRQLRELESALGVALFVTNGRARRTATEAGRRLAGVLTDLRDGVKRVQVRHDPVTSLVIGAGDSVLQWLVAPLLPSLQQRHAARLRLGTLSIADAEPLAAGRCDIALLREDDPAIDGFEQRALGTWTFAVAVPRHGRRRSITPDQLAGFSFVRTTTDPAPHGWLEQRLKTPLTVALACETYSQTSRALVGAWRQELPLAAVLPLAIASELPEAELLPLAPPTAVQTPRLILAWRSSHLGVKQHEGFQRELVAALKAALLKPKPTRPTVRR